MNEQTFTPSLVHTGLAHLCPGLTHFSHDTITTSVRPGRDPMAAKQGNRFTEERCCLRGCSGALWALTYHVAPGVFAPDQCRGWASLVLHLEMEMGPLALSSFPCRKLQRLASGVTAMAEPNLTTGQASSGQKPWAGGAGERRAG